MSLIKTAIHDAMQDAIHDQPQPAFTEQQWRHLLTVINQAINNPSHAMARTNLQHLHLWLCRIKADSAPGT